VDPFDSRVVKPGGVGLLGFPQKPTPAQQDRLVMRHGQRPAIIGQRPVVLLESRPPLDARFSPETRFGTAPRMLLLLSLSN